MACSLGAETAKKAMWLYPKVLGFNPSERWGHSACCCNGVVYVYGGCCGGLHFSDVLMLDLETMAWSTLVTTGQQPGTRDSHSAVLVGHRMIVLGGTNGSKKVNDLHILDLRTKEWTQPKCEGTPPSPRESHTATVIGDDRLVIFGGSGEGEANYLNDLHILDLKTMKWTSPKVNGDLPAPRDSHTAVAIENKLLVYGGDCGDRYHGDVDILDLDTLTWSRLAVQGYSPGVRAGHAAVNIGTKVYVIGGVGDKHYYNDVWILDVNTCSWTQLDTRGQQPQGRFSHTAVVTGSDIAIYGGCGDDERPLNELLILQLGAEHPNGRYNISLCKIFGNHWNQEKRRFPSGAENNLKCMVIGNDGEQKQRGNELESEPSQFLLCSLDNLHSKKRRSGDSRTWDVESEQEEHSLSLSQHSSPSQSDQEQTPVQKLASSATNSTVKPHPFGLFKKQDQRPMNCQSSNIGDNDMDQKSCMQRAQNFHFIGEHQRHPTSAGSEHCVHFSCNGKQEMHYLTTEQKLPGAIHSLIGAEVRGTVDGAFDSGYLMTANVNGKILRGVLFAPGPGVASRVAAAHQNLTCLTSPIAVSQSQPHPSSSFTGPAYSRPHQPIKFMMPETSDHPNPIQPSSSVRANSSFSGVSSLKNDLQGVVLTLGGPGSGPGSS
ncbi:PREDICTED: acyl-CoA-binding domain-containing protein 4-like isoform X2 [Nelumbo nucifera]|uniref:Acyl-CoA-binding domain-containing protein 4-like isoform X2 n=1 Tax=Nelumbo nucifera TaxID=4432 RepID=A0A1U7ZXL1_NELNU|nr:PREDICTED: acyl-CoA-binding domain-containing protein 4-like isoform X2 [Nelumbo nucifera]